MSLSSDLALQHQSTPPLHPSSPPNSLDDQVNNPAARVYFGPIQSPEKILIAEAAHNWNNFTSLPVSLSPQASSSQDLDNPPLFSSEEDENTVRAILDVGTADNPTLATALNEDCLQEDIELEPTSALATKISRAHDNPSPPPQILPPQQGFDDPPHLTLSEHHNLSRSTDVSPANADDLSRREPVHFPPPASHDPNRSLNQMPFASLPTNKSVDLIIFDVGKFPDITLASPDIGPFPDLLAPTPVRRSVPFVGSVESCPRISPSSPPQRPRDEGEVEDPLSPSNVATRSLASTLPVTESATRVYRSIRSVRSSSPTDVDPSTTCLLHVDTDSSVPSAVAELPPPSSHSRELRSLSPTSEGVLHNLLSTVENVTTPTHQITALPSVCPIIQPPRDCVSTPEHQSSPMRFCGSVNISDVQRPPSDRSSPWRNHIARAGSPTKLVFNNTLSDPNRTPVQRPASPKKESTPSQSNGIFGLPVFVRHTKEERTRSPVRPLCCDAVNRAAVANGVSESTVPVRLRSGSEEPNSPRKPPFPARHFSRSASDSEISSPLKSSRLPIRPVVDTRLPETIPEQSGPDSPTKSVQPSPPRKSGLRQPSSTVGSRIPRIGAKPYARPIEKQRAKGNEPAQKPVFLTRRLTPSDSALPKPVRLVNTESAKGGSDDFASSNSTNNGVPPSSQANVWTPQLSPSRKRKRLPEEMPSPSASRPTFTHRATAVSTVKRKSTSPIPPVRSSESSVPVKKPKIGNVRRMAEGTIPQKHATHHPDVQTSTVEFVKASTHPIAPLEAQAVPPALPLTTPPPSSQPGLEHLLLDVQAAPTITPNDQSTTASECHANNSNSSVGDSSPNVTRVTRSRRASQPPNDVFGTVRPLQQHRRRTTQISAGGTFPSMSAITLRALTNTNTVRNQHNLAAILETEVIRKPGNRPGSPSTKVKTIEEKLKLEPGRERRERAERRARRASEPQEDSSWTSEDEATLPLGPGGRLLRHRRGPGDEEEYESPERPRTRVHMGETGEAREEVEVKTVRWDRGLFTMIYFDDLPLQSRSHDKSHTPAAQTRGALARSAKAVRLDSLGNLVNATSPLKDIVRENVTIKKIVYDDDAEAVELDVPKPLSKSSKGKGKNLKG